MRGCWRLMRTVFLSIVSFSALLWLSCAESERDVSGEDESLDHAEPAVIVDLIVTAMTPTGVSLAWTATGDDGDSGVAAIYDLRYWQYEITVDNWDSTLPVQGLPAPGPAHARDSVSVTGLMADSTYYFAIRVADEAGNWSGLSNVAQAVCFDDYAVTFADSALERVVRFYVSKPIGDVLRSDMLALWSVNASGQHIQNLSGIEHCRNLRRLLLWNNRVTDISPLSGLVGLRVLNIGYNGLSDIGPLQSLVLLDTLDLHANAISDIAALSGMKNLLELNLSSNEIWNMAPLADNATLRSLLLDDNEIVFVNALYNVTGLDRLSLARNHIDDILPLTYNAGLGTGDTIWLTGNPLAASTTDSLIAVLRDRGVIVVN